MLEGSPHLMHGLCLPTTRGDKGQHLIGQSMFAAWTAQLPHLAAAATVACPEQPAAAVCPSLGPGGCQLELL